MERKIGEELEYDETTLKVKDFSFCKGCYFYDKPCGYSTREKTGECNKKYRSDKVGVIFKEVK